MILTWLIVVIVTKEYVSGVRTDVWKESANVQASPKQKTNIRRTPCRKYLKSSVKEGSSLCPIEPRISENVFPQTIYPISILDSGKPYYFLSESRDSIIGPFANDVKETYNYLSSKSNECQQDTCNYFVDNYKKMCEVNSKNRKRQNMKPYNRKSISKENQYGEGKYLKNRSSLLKQKSKKCPESSLPLTINVNIEVLKDFDFVNKSVDNMDAICDTVDTMCYNFSFINESARMGEMPQYDEQIVPPPLFYNYTELENTSATYMNSEDESEIIYYTNNNNINSVDLDDEILENDDYMKVSSESAILSYNNIDFSTENAITACPDY